MTIRVKWHLNVWLLFVFEIMTRINILLQSNDIHRRPCNLKAICGLLALDSVSGMLYRVQWLRKMWWIVEMKMNHKIKFYCGRYWKFERLQHAKHSIVILAFIVFLLWAISYWKAFAAFVARMELDEGCTHCRECGKCRVGQGNATFPCRRRFRHDENSRMII